jgi:MFS family permease
LRNYIRNKMNSLGPFERNSFFLICEGAVGAIVFNLVNPFISMFAKRMGAGDIEIGLLSSLPALMGILALVPGSLLVDRQRDKKKIVALLAFLAGVMYPIAALTPAMGQYRVMIYVLVIALLNWPFSVFNISWQSFFTDVFPPDKRNMAYTSRSKAATSLGTVTTLIAGLVLSWFPGSDQERLLFYQSFFILAFFLTLLQIYFLYRVKGYPVPETVQKEAPLAVLKDCGRAIFSNKPFLQYMTVSFFFHVTLQMAWPLFFIFQVDYLHADEAWLSFLTVANGIAGVVTYSYWGRMIEKKGSKWVVMIGAAGFAISPILTVLSPNLPVLLLANIASGLTFGAFQLALFDNLLEVLPQENRTLNIAIYTTFISISGFISPMIGVAIYKATSIYTAMILAGILRFIGTGLFYIRYRKAMSTE